MLLKLPQQEKIHWTNHSKDKMRYYRLSERKVLSIFKRPKRREEGVAPRTIAAMQPSGTKKNPTEIWIMYQTSSRKIKGQKTKRVTIISAWRYPGITPLGKRPLIPEDALFELNNFKEDA